MRQYLYLCLFLIAACGTSEDEKNKTAAVADAPPASQPSVVTPPAAVTDALPASQPSAEMPQAAVSTVPEVSKPIAEMPQVAESAVPAVSKPIAEAPQVAVSAAPAVSKPIAATLKAPAATAGCVGCHGAQGEGMGSFPPIAGLDAEYHRDQLSHYKSGERVDPMGMMGMAVQSLSDTDIAELAAYYAALPGGQP